MSDLLALGASLEIEVLLKLMLATVLGGLVGMEREARDKPAGFRTNVLIAIGATLFTHISIVTGAMGGDPGRIAAQVVTGVGFLGAGAVIQARGRVTGLTTAASIWVVAAIGVAVGSGSYVAAVGGTVFVLLTLMFLEKLERAFARRARYRTFTIETNNTESAADEIRDHLQSQGYRPELRRLERNPQAGTLTLLYRLHMRDEDARELVARLASNPQILSVSRE